MALISNSMRLSILLCFVTSITTFGQGLYVVKFRDKANSPFQISQPQSFLGPRSLERRMKQQLAIRSIDLPVNPTYLAQISSRGGKIIHTSRWLNAALIQTTQSQTLSQILALPFVLGLETQGDIRSGGKLISTSENAVELVNQNQSQLTQLGIDQMLQEGITGKGVLIGVFDSGFSRVNQTEAFKPAFVENRIAFTRDLVDSENDVYDDDSHGALVLSAIAANIPGAYSGTAPGAAYALFRTEDVASETKLEEWNWLVAAEIADSLGVDIINSSLGYSTFDTPAQNYVYADLTGQKALITRAANWAAGAGILVVTSAGNEGRGSWRYITAPADADSVLAVGAVNTLGQLASFSSIGPNASGQIKPEIVAMGQSTVLVSPSNSILSSSGTSFSSPLIAGMAAGIWEKYPELTAGQLRRLMMEAGSLAKTPNNQLGYGIPHWDRVREAAKKTIITQIETESITDIRTWYESKFQSQRVETSILNMSGQKLWTIEGVESHWLHVIDQIHQIGAPVFLEVKDEGSSARRKVFFP